MIPYHYPVQEPPTFGAIQQEVEYGRPSQIVVIQFRAVEPVYQMRGEQIEDPGLRYYQYVCYSCLSACGDPKNIFKTVWSSRRNMRLGPTEDQVEEMKEHAEQHSIIWGWARQQDR